MPDFKHGSGVRVKLLEAFAAGIPVVSHAARKRKSLADKDGEICALADDPGIVCSGHVVDLLSNPDKAAAIYAPQPARKFPPRQGYAGNDGTLDGMPIVPKYSGCRKL